MHGCEAIYTIYLSLFCMTTLNLRHITHGVPKKQKGALVYYTLI